MEALRKAAWLAQVEYDRKQEAKRRKKAEEQARRRKEVGPPHRAERREWEVPLRGWEGRYAFDGCTTVGCRLPAEHICHGPHFPLDGSLDEGPARGGV